MIQNLDWQMEDPEKGLMPTPEKAAEAQVPFNPNKVPAKKQPGTYYDLMLALSDLGAKEKQIKGQMEVANELRKTDMPGMRTAGRIVKAAHPLEFANTAYNRFRGGVDREKAFRDQEGLAGEIRRRIQEERGWSGEGLPTSGDGGYAY